MDGEIPCFKPKFPLRPMLLSESYSVPMNYTKRNICAIHSYPSTTLDTSNLPVSFPALLASSLNSSYYRYIHQAQK